VAVLGPQLQDRSTIPLLASLNYVIKMVQCWHPCKNLHIYKEADQGYILQKYSLSRKFNGNTLAKDSFAVILTQWILDKFWWVWELEWGLNSLFLNIIRILKIKFWYPLLFRHVDHISFLHVQYLIWRGFRSRDRKVTCLILYHSNVRDY
jgi:hypothetical protein